MGLRVILSDVDGCVVGPGYDTYGKIQEGPDATHDKVFEFYREFNALPFYPCTGRSYECAEGIVKRMGDPKYGVFENGVDILIDGEFCSIFDLPGFSKHADDLKYMREIGTVLMEKSQRIRELCDAGHDVVFPPKKHLITIDIPYIGTHEDSERVDPEKFYDTVMSVLPPNLKEVIEGDKSKITAFMNRDVALDFKIQGIGKPEGANVLLNEIGIPLINAMLIEDADHKSLEKFYWRACPANALDDVKKSVISMSVNGMGYVSQLDAPEGMIDILRIAKTEAI